MRQVIPIISRSEIAEAWRSVKLATLAGVDEDGWSSKYKYSASKDETHGKVLRLNFWHDQREDWQKTLELVFERAPTRRKNSLFARIPGRGVYVVHSGLIGGHGPHAGKRKFVKWYSACYGNSRFVDVSGATYILVGRVGAPDLQRQVAEYVRDRQRFRAGEKPKPSGPTRPRRVNSVPWKPRSPKVLVIKIGMPKSVRRRRRHEAVVDAVGRQLAKLHKSGIHKDKGGERDIYTKQGNWIAVLFEVKTKCSTTDVQTGAGQLMLHGAAQTRPPVRVLVLPDMPCAQTATRLRRLGIRVQLYSWRVGVPVLGQWFENKR